MIPRIEYLTGVGFPFATFGRSQSGGTTYPSIDLDFVRAGQESVDRLVDHGHRPHRYRYSVARVQLRAHLPPGVRQGLKRNAGSPSTRASRNGRGERGRRLHRDQSR